MSKPRVSKKQLIAKRDYDRILWETRSIEIIRGELLKLMDRLMDDGLARLEQAKARVNALEVGEPYP